VRDLEVVLVLAVVREDLHGRILADFGGKSIINSSLAHFDQRLINLIL